MVQNPSKWPVETPKSDGKADLDAKTCIPATIRPHLPTDDTPQRALRHRAYQRAYEEWFNALPPAEQARLRGLGLDEPENEQFGPVRDDGDAGAGGVAEIASERHQAESWRVDELNGTVEDENELATAFGEALAWCAKAPNLVAMGQRYLAVLHIWKPSLVAGLTLQIERELLEEFRDRMDDGDDDGSVLGPVLEWGRRGTSLAQIGQRLLAMAYVLRPSLIGGRTLAWIGGLTGKTRQAVDKLVQDFRDTFGGIRSRNMRPEENRIVCRNAQLHRI